MEVHTCVLRLMVLLLVARLFADVAARFSVPSVIGELLFEVGLETDVRRLIHAGSGSLIIALKWFSDRFGDGLPTEEPVE